MRILDIDELLAGQQWALKLGIPVETAFPELESPASRDFFESARCLKHLINWMWLSAHKCSSTETIVATASEVITRAVQVYERAAGQKHRGEHDLFLLSAAIIAGGRTSIEQVRDCVAYAQESYPPPYYSSGCGILKARLAGDTASERTQLELHVKCKGSGSIYRLAGRAAYTSFVEGDIKTLVRNCHKVCEGFWATLEKQNAARVFRRDGEAELGAWQTNAFWPWPELTLLKLAPPALNFIESDDFWIPRRLLAMRGG